MSKANDDFPEPERPVITTSLFRGIATSMFFKLCCLAPFIMIYSLGLRFKISLVLFINLEELCFMIVSKNYIKKMVYSINFLRCWQVEGSLQFK